MHSLRPHPQLLAWCKVLVDLAKAVHDANTWIRACMHNGSRIFEDLDDGGLVEANDDEFMPPPPQEFLDAVPAAAVASLHRSLIKRPRLSALLGATGCEHSVAAAQILVAHPSARARFRNAHRAALTCAALACCGAGAPAAW
jgi:hypothetical protein